MGSKSRERAREREERDVAGAAARVLWESKVLTSLGHVSAACPAAIAATDPHRAWYLPTYHLLNVNKPNQLRYSLYRYTQRR